MIQIVGILQSQRLISLSTSFVSQEAAHTISVMFCVECTNFSSFVILFLLKWILLTSQINFYCDNYISMYLQSVLKLLNLIKYLLYGTKRSGIVIHKYIARQFPNSFTESRALIPICYQ